MRYVIRKQIENPTLYLNFPNFLNLQLFFTGFLWDFLGQWT